MPVDIPWDDLKVAFSYDGDVEKLWKRVESGRRKFPDGWKLVESDTSGARAVVVFRVEGIPSVVDALVVRRKLDDTARNYP
jgi:hypothetical protein